MKTLPLFLSAFLTFGILMDATAADQVKYDLHFDDAETHSVNVKLTFANTSGQDRVTVMMPVWTPGSYLVREYARNIDQVSAADQSGQPLGIVKTTKNRWEIAAKNAKTIVVSYRLYCREMSVRTNWVETDFAMLNGASTFLTPVDAGGKAHQVHLHLPKNWSRSVCALDAVPNVKHAFVAAQFEDLVDSPILCGNPEIAEFEIDGIQHALVNLGDASLWDTKKSAQDVERIVKEQQKFWGHVPYPRYLVLNMITESRGGLEHDNSTLLMTSRWNYRDKEKYEDWLSLVSHEFFHTWNVRRLRPIGLRNYDFENENYTRSLWVAEGVTNYIEDVILARAGLIKDKVYLKRFSKQIAAHQQSPGRLVQSLADSSYDTWIKFYRPDANSKNTRISYYVKGAIVAFLLDARIRELTNNAKSIDDVMRLLYERCIETGYSDDDVLKVATDVAGQDLRGWFVEHIDRAHEVNYQPALDWYGIEFSDGKPAEESAKAGKTDKKEASDQSKPKRWLGFKSADKAGQLRVTEVLHGSPAADAGLNVDDEILALDGFRLTATDSTKRLSQYKVGEKLKLLIARRDAIRELTITIGSEPNSNWTLRVRKDATDKQKQNLRAWLGTSD